MGSPIHEVRRPEKLEIIRLVEHSSLQVRRTLEQCRYPTLDLLSLVRSLSERSGRGSYGSSAGARRVWKKLPTAVTQAVLELALKEPQLSPRELAVSFVDQQ
jgi:putative transposase